MHFGCISSLWGHNDVAKESESWHLAILVELRSLRRREDLPQTMDIPCFFRVCSMLFPLRIGVEKNPLKARWNVTCPSHRRAKALCAQSGSWQGWSQGGSWRGTAWVSGPCFQPEWSGKNAGICFKKSIWMIRRSTGWFPGEKNHPQDNFYESSLWSVWCPQGAGERDQSISWDPINVNVSNEAGHGLFEVCPLLTSQWMQISATVMK